MVEEKVELKTGYTLEVLQLLLQKLHYYQLLIKKKFKM